MFRGQAGVCHKQCQHGGLMLNGGKSQLVQVAVKNCPTGDLKNISEV